MDFKTLRASPFIPNVPQARVQALGVIPNPDAMSQRRDPSFKTHACVLTLCKLDLSHSHSEFEVLGFKLKSY